MNPHEERLLELLADRAVVGLGPREQIELAELLIAHPGVDADYFDRAAAAVALASLGPLEPLPAHLAARIEAEAAHAAPTFVHSAFDRTELEPAAPPGRLGQTQPLPDRARPASLHPARPSAPAPAPAPAHVRPFPPEPTPPPSYAPIPFPVRPIRRAPSRAFAMTGWFAAAACFLLAIGAIVYASRTRSNVANVTPTATVPTAPIPSAPEPPPSSSSRLAESPSALREKLLASAGSARAEWSATKDPAGKGASGDVVWNAAEQKGTMRFRGLAKNDPRRLQYQLWIFDKNRDEKYPVDGGVFDIDSETGDVVVAIKATLPVSTPVLFAVTIEKPGGVVVSKRERIVVTAKLPAG